MGFRNGGKAIHGRKFESDPFSHQNKAAEAVVKMLTELILKAEMFTIQQVMWLAILEV